MSGSTTTRIDGPLVTLEVPGQEHLPAIWKVYLDAPDYFEALTGSSDFDPTDVEMMYEEAISDDSRFYFAVRRTDTKALIGTIEIESGSDELPAALRGLVIAQGERGKGTAARRSRWRSSSWRTSWGCPRSRRKCRRATTTASASSRPWGTGSAGSSPGMSVG